MFKFLIILLIVGGLMALGILYIKKRFRAFIGKMIDPRQAMGNMGDMDGRGSNPFSSPKKINQDPQKGQEIYNKDGVRIMKGEAGKNN